MQKFLEGATVFSTLDAKFSSRQVAIDEDDQEKTSIMTHDGFDRCFPIPLGLKDARWIFQAVAEVIRAPVKGNKH